MIFHTITIIIFLLTVIPKEISLFVPFFLLAWLPWFICCPLCRLTRYSCVSFAQPTSTNGQRVQISRRTIFEDVRKIESRHGKTLHHKLSSVMSLWLSSDITNALTRHVLTTQ